jgi:hypothetical protein
MPRPSIVGDVINFRGFVYGPVNEMGVVALFAKVSDELGFIIEEIRAEFPDCIARRQVDRGWERVAIEFEFKSSSFQRHGHDANACDLIVCWEHDWETCPISALPLKPYITGARANPSAPLNGVRISEPLETRRVALTAGGIRNGYISIQPLDAFWPEECFGGCQQRAQHHLIVEFDGLGRVSTDISGRHKTFRTTHTQVKEFVRRHGLRPGDSVEIIRVAKYEYRIRVAAPRDGATPEGSGIGH